MDEVQKEFAVKTDLSFLENQAHLESTSREMIQDPNTLVLVNVDLLSPRAVREILSKHGFGNGQTLKIDQPGKKDEPTKAKIFLPFNTTPEVYDLVRNEVEKQANENPELSSQLSGLEYFTKPGPDQK